MVKNVIKGSFPVSKVLLFEVIATSEEKMKILDYFMIAHGKEYDLKALFLFQSFSFRGL